LVKEEINRLKSDETKLIVKIEDDFSYLKSNYKKLIWNSINPFKNKDSIASIVYSAGKQILLPKSKSEENANLDSKPESEIIALIVSSLINRLRKKRKKKSADKVKKS